MVGMHVGDDVAVHTREHLVYGHGQRHGGVLERARLDEGRDGTDVLQLGIDKEANSSIFDLEGCIANLRNLLNGPSVLRLQHEERDERDGDEGQRERGHGDACGIVAVGAALRGDHGDDGHGGKRRDECDGGHHVGGQRRLV